VRVSYLKQQITQITKDRDEFEKMLRMEREKKDEYIKKADAHEKRCLDAESEVLMHRKRTATYEEKYARMRRQVYDLETEQDEIVQEKNLSVALVQK
jgi:chromosome segregation ATPase